MQDIYANLDPQQLKAVKHGNGPLMVISCAGSGKTRSLTHRVAHLVHMMGVDPSNIVATTFTNRAADEMRNRLHGLIGPAAGKLTIGTVHALCLRIVRTAGPERFGLSQGFSVYGEDESRKLAGKVVGDLYKTGVASRIIRQEGLDQEIRAAWVQSTISNAKEQGFTPHNVTMLGRRGRIVAPFYAEYNRRLRECNSLDFGDMQLLAVEALTNDAKLLDEVQTEFWYVLVDEYQDTNDIQAELFKLIAGGYHNIAVYGDFSQAIFSFRYANPKHLEQFPDEWPNTTIVILPTNYRSTKHIVDASTAVIKNNETRFEVPYTSVRELGAPVKIVVEETDRLVAQRIAKLVMAHYATTPLEQMAVLYRYHRSSNVLETVFREKGIPFHLVGGISFYVRKEVQDVLAWVRLLTNPQDSAAFERVCKSVKGVGAGTISRIGNTPLTEENVTHLPLRPSQREGLLRIVATIEVLKDYKDSPELVKHVVDVSNYFAQLLLDDKETAKTRADNVNELIRTYFEFGTQFLKARGGEVQDEGAVQIDLSRYQHLGGNAPKLPTVAEAFLEYVALANTKETGQDGVRFSTIHAAKGREFDVVFVVNCEKGVHPPLKAEDGSEERRIFYVAMTRAENHLYLLHARTAPMFGNIEPSPYLYEAKQGGAIWANPEDLPQPRPIIRLSVVPKPSGPKVALTTMLKGR